MKFAMSREAMRLLCRFAFAKQLAIAAGRLPRNARVQGLCQRRGFAETSTRKAVKPYLLADIGEGE